MGLDIGIIHVSYLERPSGTAYDFAWELAEQCSATGYMNGAGGSWGWVEREQVSELLNDFTARKRLSPKQRAEVSSWIESLPWRGAGSLELHFNW